MSLTTCLKRAGKNLNAEDKTAILEAARANRKAGMSADDAAKAAVRARLEEVQALLAADGEAQVSTWTDGAPAPAAPKTLKERAEANKKPKVYKTRAAAEAEKNGNTMRLRKVQGGYILRPATDKELVAAERAGRRLAGGGVDVERDSLLVAIAKLGGLSMRERSDTIGEGNRNIGGKMLFRQDGRPLDDLARNALREFGYVPASEVASDGGVRWLRDAIKSEFMGSQQYWSEQGTDAIMRREQEEAFQAAQQEEQSLSDFDADDLQSSGYTAASPEIQALTESLIAEAEALGIDTEGIREDTAKANESATEDAYHAAVQEAIAQAIRQARGATGSSDAGAARTGGQDRGAADGEAGQEGLTAPTPESLRAADERRQAAERADAAEQRRLADRRRADAERDEFVLTGSDRPADVAAAAGQGGLFDAPAAPAQPAAASAARAESAARRINPVTTIDFAKPIVGPTGARLKSYTWQWKPMEFVDARGEERVKRISDWDASEASGDTGRGVVHQFVVDDGGADKVVSAESALKLLGFTAGSDGKAGFTSLSSAAKTLARLRMQEAELQQAKEQFDRDKADVMAMALPAMPTERDGKGWFNMGDASVRQIEPGAMTDERRRSLIGAWRDNRMAERGWRTGSEDTLRVGLRETADRIKRQQAKVDRLVGEAASAAPPAKQAEPAPVSSREGQMNLANRGARIASLMAMNNRLRQIAPERAWADTNIENASNAELDRLQDQISAALVEAQRGPAPVNPLRAELEAMSGTELRDLMGRMGLAGKLMTAGERVDALLAEEPAEVRAAMQQAEPTPRASEGAADVSTRTDAKPGAKSKIGDFGEKLEGARKDYATTLKDAEAVDVAAEPLSKSWPEPDYQKLLDSGVDRYIVALVRAARDEVPTKPQKAWKLKGWVDTVKSLRETARSMLAGDVKAADARRIVNNTTGLIPVRGRAELYEELGHDRSLKGVTFGENFYSFYRGQNNVRKWVVEQKAKATAFSNWPRELAVADTREAALQAFKDKLGTLDLGGRAKGQPQFVIYRKRGQDGAFVGKKIGREYIDLHKAADVAAARAYMQSNAADLEKALEAYKATPFERKTENQPRVGDDHRNGAPVTPEVFAETFGFRGVQFGNYVEQGRRQSDLNEAFDGLMDLAAILGIPPRALSLNGQLGLAFGARGKGGTNAAAAHYEPDKVVINLTKGSGAGSLAHEWWHALDNYFAKKGESTGFVTGGAKAAALRAQMRAAFETVKQATSGLAYQQRARELDKRRSKPYWNTPEERSARAFESYVIAKLQDQGVSNDYLANVVSEQFWNASEALRAGMFSEGESKPTYPYPLPAELPAVRAGFDEFFKTVETSTDDAGNVALFSRTGSLRAPGAVPARDLRTEVSKITATWDQDLADVEVVNRVEDLPADIRQAVRNVGSENTVRGLAMPDGRVFLVAENISSLDEGRFVLFHEVYGHVGMQAFLGDGYATQMRVLRTANPALAREADAWFDRYGEDEIAARVKAGFSEAKARAMVEALAVEEALADRAGTLPELKGWKLVMAALQRGLRRLGLGSVADMLEGMTEAETVDLLVQARRTVQAGQRVRGVEMAGNPAFQRVWHGTHTRGIEEFSTDYIGTGEGVQAFGWGLYFATKKEIAEHYREKLSAGGKFTRIDGKRWDFGSDLSRPLTESERLDNLAVGMLQQAQSASGLEALAKRRDADPAVVKRAREMLPRVSWAPSGQTYEVDIPEDSEMLLWDKPLSEQPQAIRDAVYGASEGKWVTGQSGERRFIEAPAAWMTGGAAYARVSRLLGGDIQASKALRAAGIRGIKYLDGTSRNAGDGTFNYVIFDGADAKIQGALFSRRPDRAALRDAIPPAVQEWVSDRMVSQRGFNRIWHRTVGTQIHKAKVNKEFGRAYYAVQDFMKDVSRMATLAAEKAPDMLPQIETLNDLARLAPTLASPAAYKQRKADIKAASDALFDGTLRYTRDDEGKAVKVDPDSDELGGLVWTDAELKARGMSARAIAMYRQSRAAIEQSLDSMLAADLYRQVSVMDPELVAATPSDYNALMAGLRRAAASDTPGDAVQSLRSAIASRLDAVQGALDGQPNQHTPGLMQRRQDLRKLQEMIGEKVNRIQDLKDAGYAPLMRFGPYAVDVVNPDGRRVFFGMYESQAAANQAARNFRGDGLIVTQSVMPQKQFEALQGVSPETAMLFAEMLGVEKNEAMQTWLKNAVAEQSALKRHIRRKGIDGFDDDGGRVLAAFITSNARAASRALHSQRISEAVENIRQGDVQDEARALAEYVSNPKEEAQAIRSLLFVQYIGGSIASAIVNLTQTVVQTFPFLSQYGGGIKAGQRIGAAVKQALAGKIDAPDLAAAVARAEKDGIIKPQEVFQLQAEASRNLGSNLYARSLLAAWGSMFQLAEVFNRRVAFIAAYQTAKEQGIADPFGFAENAVDETQSVFNKGNRPNWARGAVGATIFTFKTFTIQYVEFLKRLATAGEPGSPERARGQKAAALALLALVVLAGMKGLPFAEDAEDLIDTVAQALGYNWTTDAAIDKWLNETLGEVWADIVQHGMSGVPGVPFDVSQRLGMANLLPGTGLLKQSETNKQNQVLEVFGVAGSAVRDATQGQFLPIAIRNLMIGLDTYETGLYRDRRGRAVTEADPLDAALKAIGLQPNNVARAQRDIGRQIELRSLYQAVKEEITDSWAQAQFAGDTDGVEKARRALRRWNDMNPEARIIILPRTIQQRVIQMRRSKAERTIANAPRPLRASTTEALE